MSLGLVLGLYLILRVSYVRGMCPRAQIENVSVEKKRIIVRSAQFLIKEPLIGTFPLEEPKILAIITHQF